MKRTRKPRRFRRAAAVAFCLFLASPVIGYSVWMLEVALPGAPHVFAEDDLGVWNYAGRYGVLKYIKENVPGTSGVLVFRLADFAYYSGHRMTPYRDPLLMALYEAETKEEAYEELLSKGIDYVYIPWSMHPACFNSSVHEVLADISMSELEVQDGLFRLYRIRPERAHHVERPIPLPPPDVPSGDIAGNPPANWSLHAENWVFGSRTLADYQRKDGLEWGVVPDSDGLNAFHVDFGSTLFNEYSGYPGVNFVSGRGNYFMAPSACFFDGAIAPLGYYRMRARVRGTGVFRLSLVEYSSLGRQTLRRVWDSTLPDEWAEVSAVFQASSSAVEFRVMLSLPFRGELWLRDLDMSHVELEPHAIDWPEVESVAKPQVQYTWEPSWSQDFETPGGVSDAKPFFEWPWADPRGRRFGHAPESLDGLNSIYATIFVDTQDAGTFAPKRPLSERIGTRIQLAQMSFRKTTHWWEENLAYTSRKLTMRRFFWWAMVKTFSGDEDEYRLRATVKGRGYVDVVIAWTDANGDTGYEYVTRSFLAETFRELQARFSVPAGAKIQSPLFLPLPPEYSGEPSGLVHVLVDDVHIERGTPVAAPASADESPA